MAAMSNGHRKVLKRAMQKSAEAVLVLACWDEGPNMKDRK